MYIKVNKDVSMAKYTWKNKLKNIAMAVSIGAVTLGNHGCRNGDNHDDVADKKENILKTDTVKSPIEDVTYRNDTLDYTPSVIMYYVNKSITRNYVENNNSFRMQLPYVVHENWHKHNDEIGFRRKLVLSPVEYYKLCMYDEISANLAAVLTARYEYLASTDKADVIKKYENTYMGFYFKAIKNGEINPSDDTVEMREKEWHFLANGVQNMWMKYYYKTYSPTFSKMVKNYIKRHGIIENNHANYNYVKKHMMTIGGVNFAKYLEHEVSCRDGKVCLIDGLRQIETFKSGFGEIVEIVNNNFELVSQVDIEKQQEAFQHLLISSKLKYMLRGVDDKNLTEHPNIINSCYNKILTMLKKDNTVENVLNNVSIDYESPKIYDNYEDVVKKMYMFNDVDLTQLITNYSYDNLPYKNNLSLIDNNVNKVNLLDCSKDEDILENLRNRRNVVDSNKNNKMKKRRISSELHINIPNFRAPILIACSNEQQSAILGIMREFDEMPDVLKSCNTKAIKKYILEQKKYTK